MTGESAPLEGSNDLDPQQHGYDAKEQMQIEKVMRKAEVASSMRPPVERKRSFCRRFWKALLGSRMLISKYDREEYIRTLLAELAIYLVYLTIMCIITYGMTVQSTYYYTNTVTNLFVDTPFQPSNATFRTSTSTKDFWEFAETTMQKGLYWKYWYGVVDPVYAIPSQDQGVMHENRLLGRPRLRQLRVSETSCPISEKFNRLYRECYPPYSRDQEDKNKYHPVLGHLDAWHYHKEDELNGTPHFGRLATYSGAGAFQLLGNDEPESLQMISELKRNLWITRATRVVFLDFTLYNANENLFCIATLIWEFPPTGGVLTSWSIRSIRLIRYVSTYEYFILVMEAIFIIHTIYYTLQEFYEMAHVKCWVYWSNFWSILDVSILCLSYVCIGFSIYRHFLVKDTLHDLIKDPNDFANFYWLGLWEAHYDNTVAVCVFLAWIKLFKYVSFNKTMSQLSSTMSRCAKDVGGFAIMFFIVFFAFSQLGYLLFGSEVEDFQSFPDTVFTLLRLILGDFNYRAIETANRYLGPAFFITYVFFVFFVLLNMFLAIINDTYSQVKQEIESHLEEFQVVDYLKRGINRMLGTVGCRNKNVDLQGQIKLANTQNMITSDELRHNLKQSGYSDVEVEMFLTRYELDEDRPMDEDEAENILGGLEGYHSQDGRGDELHQSNDQGRAGEKSAAAQLTDQEISELQSRVGILESSLTGVTRKIDTLLGKLDYIGGNNVPHKPRPSAASRGRRSTFKDIENPITDEEMF